MRKPLEAVLVGMMIGGAICAAVMAIIVMWKITVATNMVGTIIIAATGVIWLKLDAMHTTLKGDK